MKHTRCMFHFCFQCFILQALTVKKRNLVQEISFLGARDTKV